jgi:hypothetical protein
MYVSFNGWRSFPFVFKYYIKKPGTRRFKVKREMNYAPVMNFDNSLNEIAARVKVVGGIAVVKRGEPCLAREW